MRVTQVDPRKNGIAGQYAHVVHTVDNDGYPWISQFVGNVNGGAVYVRPAGASEHYRIDSAVVERCGGVLNPEFIRNFYAEEA